MDESQKHCAKWNKQNTKTKYYVILFTWTVVKKKTKNSRSEIARGWDCVK